MTAEQTCELCGRTVSELTRHHLIPRTRHRNKRVRRLFSREEMNTKLIWVCYPCHRHIHTVLSEKELALEFNTLRALSVHPEIEQFVNWIRKKSSGLKPRGVSRKKYAR